MKKCRFLAMMSVCLMLTLSNFTNTGLTEVFANPEEVVVTETPSDMPEGSGQLESDGGDGSTSFTSTLPEEISESEVIEEKEDAESEESSSVQEPFAKEEAPKKNYFFGYIVLFIITATITVGIRMAYKKMKQKEAKSKYNPDMMYNPMKTKLK